MRGACRITCLWPGLFRLWFQGELFALAIAIVFAVLFNIGLVATFVVPGRLSWWWCLSLWMLVSVVWSIGVWRAFRAGNGVDGEILGAHDQQDLFIRAQAQYLKGHWVQAQVLLEQLIRNNPGDVESHLLLSSVYRRTGRLDLSRRQLARAEAFPGASRWRVEIGRERGLLGQLGTAPT